MSREPCIVEVWGYSPVPHDFTVRVAGDGRGIIKDPNPRLKLWQKRVRAAAVAAWGSAKPWCGDVRIDYEFYSGPAYGKAPGDRWSKRGWWDARRKKFWSDESPQGDLDNQIKAVTDSLKGVVIADDVLVTDLGASKRYGLRAGVRMTVWFLD